MIARAVEIKPDSEAVNSSSAINLRIADRNFDKSKSPSRELIDVQFDRLLVKKRLGKAASSKNSSKPRYVDYWLCSCSCEDPEFGQVVANTWDLKRGRVTSCGCKVRTHNMSSTRVYNFEMK